MGNATAALTSSRILRWRRSMCFVLPLAEATTPTSNRICCGMHPAHYARQYRCRTVNCCPAVDNRSHAKAAWKAAMDAVSHETLHTVRARQCRHPRGYWPVPWPCRGVAGGTPVSPVSLPHVSCASCASVPPCLGTATAQAYTH